MRLDRLNRGIVLALAVTLAAASLASPADAGHGRRYKGNAHVVYVARPARTVYVTHRSYGAPALAGFVGGLVIGTALAQAAAPPPVYCAPAPVVYEYYDPYCHRDFVSLDHYYSHLHYCSHPRVVRVIEVDTGRCIGERYWYGGSWYWDD